MLNVVMLNVVMLNVVMLIVVAPLKRDGHHWLVLQHSEYRQLA
jgi:hypothetical protein